MMMALKQWLGGGNNYASNPKDWSPAGVPGAGDTPFIASGTMVVIGTALSTVGIDLNGPGSNFYPNYPVGYSGPIRFDLYYAHLNEFAAGLYLNVSPVITFNIYDSTLALTVGSIAPPYQGVSPTVNMYGSYDFFDTVVASGSENIYQAFQNLWVGSVTVDALGNHGYGGPVTVHGAIGSMFYNLNSEIDNSHTTFDTDIVGAGMIGMGLHSSYGSSPATLEFMRGVTAGQTITMANSVNAGNILAINNHLVLDIDKPGAFLGTVNFAEGQINLLGLAKADSYSFTNGVLSIYAGNAVIDRLKMNDQTPKGFVVDKTSTGVNIFGVDGLTAPSGRTTIPGTLLAHHA